MFAVDEDVRDGALSSEVQEGRLQLNAIIQLIELDRRVRLLERIKEFLRHPTEWAPANTLGRSQLQLASVTRVAIWPHVVLE